MRSLFTQLSFMVGLLMTLNLQAEMPLAYALLFGFSAACTVYLALLIGDVVVHRLLEDRTDRVSSVVFMETPPELDEHQAKPVDERADEHLGETGARAA